MVDDILTWKSYIEMIILKLSVACFAVRATKPFVMLVGKRLRTIYILTWWANMIGKPTGTDEQYWHVKQ